MNECGFKNCICKKSNKWKINSIEYNNCFWFYIAKNRKDHTLQEVADLLDLHISTINTIEKKALDKLKIFINKKS